MLKSLAILAAVMAVSSPFAARAAPLEFSFQAATNPSSNFDFHLDSAPTPSFTDGIETIFELSGVEDSAPASYEVRFYNSDVSGGLSVDYPSNQNLNFSGQQIYSGSENKPTFMTGLYPLFYAPDYNAPDFDFDAPPVFAGNLVIAPTALVSAAPEPGTWALMMLGVGAIGGMLGYRKRVIVDHKAKLATIG